MTFQGSQFLIESIVPTILAGTICILALAGVKELLQETSEALKKRVKA